MGFKIDLHVHTRHSGDSDAGPEEMVREAIRRGLDGLAFTEHNSYAASGHAEDLQKKYAGSIRIFRGVEISAREGHCLVFGIDPDPLKLNGEPVAEVARMVAGRGGVLILSHPYRRGHGLGDLVRELKDITAIEGYNGCNLYAMNMMAVEVAGELGLPVTGGSDAHTPEEVGSCYTEFESDVDEKNLVRLLRGGRYTGVDVRKISRVPWPL
jgi:predicted metal-dependent phosphoesterase TrpH